MRSIAGESQKRSAELAIGKSDKNISATDALLAHVLSKYWARTAKLCARKLRAALQRLRLV